MPKKKQEIETPEEPTPEEIEDSQDFLTLEEKLVSEVGSGWVKKLKQITYYTSRVGLTLREACQLSDTNFEEFMNLANSNETVRNVLEKKELEYKKGLLFTLSAKGKQGDDKLAMWLLERRFPEEFSTKRRGGGAGEVDLLGQAIIFIQKNGDHKPLVSQESGLPLISQSGRTTLSATDKLKKLLA